MSRAGQGDLHQVPCRETGLASGPARRPGRSSRAGRRSRDSRESGPFLGQRAGAELTEIQSPTLITQSSAVKLSMPGTSWTSVIS